MSTDNEIIARSRAAPAAFAELHERHHLLIHRYVARRTNSAIADDVMSETFLVAFEERGRFDAARGEVRSWLLGIATTLLKKHRRVEAQEWRNFTAVAASSGNAFDSIADTDSRLDADSRVRGLSQAILALSRGDRDVLLLYAWGDLDYGGVAQALGIPVGTVRSRLNRARRQLQRATERQTKNESRSGHGQDRPATSRAR